MVPQTMAFARLLFFTANYQNRSFVHIGTHVPIPKLEIYFVSFSRRRTRKFLALIYSNLVTAKSERMIFNSLRTFRYSIAMTKMQDLKLVL